MNALMGVPRNDRGEFFRILLEHDPEQWEPVLREKNMLKQQAGAG